MWNIIISTLIVWQWLNYLTADPPPLTFNLELITVVLPNFQALAEVLTSGSTRALGAAGVSL